MPASRLELLRWQFDLVWSLFELHLDQLASEDFRWEPAGHTWTVRSSDDGTWVPDFAETEPDPIPIPTIAWTTWHIGWWWTVTIDHAQERTPRDRTEIKWPGDGQPTIDWLRGLRADWLAVLGRLTDAELDGTAPFPWQNDPEMTVAHMVGWVNAELMKNAAEIGQLRLLRAVPAA
ncbi:damage-inducible protein DinB [Amycolatopsis antarctica]|uniref:Damage-inducible protein DinB n=1 Tax=Amycolatopsis antarctica TaxID=1854586 RepID=A0A263D524_9PSEU|nr:DinB family protein [Amycolatopsis antarctica]OZM72576.1 damage-inducible protein DinB [Amycolatopsis antarctica]